MDELGVLGELVSPLVVAKGAAATQGDRVDLTIVVPAFNEGQRLPLLLRALRQAGFSRTTEIVVVDDGSGDDTVEVAEREGAWCENFRVIEHRRNRGKGAAVKTGVQAARGRIVAFVDADNATDLSAIDPMCDLIEGSVGAVFGSRHAPGAVVTGSPPIRGVMGRVFNHVVRYAAGTTIRDTQCGAKVFWTPAARAAFSGLEIEGFAFDVEIVRRLSSLAVDTVEYPVQWKYMAGSKIRPITPLRMLIDIIKLRVADDAPQLLAFERLWDPSTAEQSEPLIPGGHPNPGQRVTVVVPEDALDRANLVAKYRAEPTRVDRTL